MDKKVLSALIGLVGAINSNGKTEYTDNVVRDAVLGSAASDEKKLQDCQHDMVEKIHREKFKIAPNCATCQSPCGNTSDYPFEKYDEWSPEQRRIKELILGEAERIVRYMQAGQELPEIVYKAIAYVSYDLRIESYEKLLEEMKTW